MVILSRSNAEITGRTLAQNEAELGMKGIDMWPFRKAEPRENPTLTAINNLREFCGVGDSFMYLGRKCVVTGHFEMMPWGFVPLLKFDYCDDRGVLHNRSAMLSEIEALRKNPDA